MYLAGSTINSAASINSLDALLYRANGIETFDTCAVLSNLDNGVEMLAISSHTVQRHYNAKYQLTFETGLYGARMMSGE